MLHECGIELSCNTIQYGELVDVDTPSGTACGCKVHFFNKKGVLVGREYKFLKYDKIRRHPKGLCWEQRWVVFGKDDANKKLWRQHVYEIACRLITRLMRWTQGQTLFEGRKKKFRKVSVA